MLNYAFKGISMRQSEPLRSLGRSGWHVLTAIAVGAAIGLAAGNAFAAASTAIEFFNPVLKHYFITASVFGVLAPGPTRNCSSGSVPVYRLYNSDQGAAPNHRYTTNRATRATMLGNGWIAEGYGDQGLIMCSPV